MQAKPAIEFEEVTVRFPLGRRRGGDVRALDGFCFRAEAGKIYGLIGPNGAGKTTSIQALLGFLPPTAGTVRLFGQDARNSPSRARIGYLPESASFYPHLSGRELLCLFGALFDIPRKTVTERADRLLAETGLQEAADRRLEGYSRGMLQRIGLAQALINDPDLIILDEPTSGMDPIGRAEVRRLISSWKNSGKTVLFSSHELSEVERVCDEVALMARGRLIAQGAPGTLSRTGESLEQFFLRMMDVSAGKAAVP